MSILDQLRQEKAQIDQAEQPANVKDSRREELLFTAMKRIFNYMSEVVKLLNELNHTLTLDFYSFKFQSFGKVKQQGYRIFDHMPGPGYDPNKLEMVVVQYFCYAESEPAYSVEGQRLINQEVNYLHDHHISFDWNYCVGKTAFKAANFKIHRKFPVFFKFSIDKSRRNILLEIKNHEDIKKYHVIIEPEQIDDDFLDGVVKLMLREETINSHNKKFNTKMLSTF